MTPERWREVERVYQAALDRDASARSAFLDEVCAGNAELRREVESLLAEHRPGDRFLESSAMQMAARALAQESTGPRRGQRLGSYELVERIGAGGMGEVWRAHDAALSRHVAIKLLSSQYSRDPDRLRRFEQEARAAGMLNHPNVLAIYAIGKHADAPYLVTELLEGATLRERLADGAIPESKAIDYADQIVQGLSAAHEKGIVHRDLKPENIFITSDGRVKILDFGLAKLAPSGPEHQAQTQTATGIALGTPAYMSPEQVRGQPADHRSDIFAFGAVLYEMVAGRRAFPGETSVETMNAILKEDLPPIPSVSLHVDQIVRHCLEKEPAARYQSARDLGFQLRLVRHPSGQTLAPAGTRTRRQYVAWSVVGLLLLGVTSGVTWWLTHPGPAAPGPVLTRITDDSGLTTDPAFSPDGKLMVYASDRAGEGNLDIWRHQLTTGEAIPLTRDPADESEPAFSPDGSQIVFRSERDGGGIWVVSAFGGGEPRLIATQGRRPRFSPDGTRIAYWAGVHYFGKVFVVPVGGGPPAPVQPEFASALYPIWAPDGKHLLMVAARDPTDVPVDGGFDWWVVPLNGGPPIQTGVSDVFRRHGMRESRQAHPSLIRPGGWAGEQVLFSAWTNDSVNLWRLTVSPGTWRVDGPPQRLTSGTSIEGKPAVSSDGRVAFASLSQDLNIWSLPIAADTGKVTGSPQQLTSSAYDAQANLSADGTRLAFLSMRSGNPDVWIKDLLTGKETALTTTPSIREEQPELIDNASWVAYGVVEGSKIDLYRMPTAGGVPEKICDDCGRPWDWSPDGSKLMYLIQEGRRQPGLALGLLEVTTRQKTVYLEHPRYSLARPRFSPDGRWVTFIAIEPPAGSRIVVAPFQDRAPREDQWISITEATTLHEKPHWSPDGNLLYYTSDADGFRCIWAQRLDSLTKRPLGQPLEVYHSHSARRSLMNAAIPLMDISLGQDRLVFNLGGMTGNIWMAEWNQ